MINDETAKKYCKEYWEIENYEEAKNSSEKWQCHHRLETHFSDGTERPINARLFREELISLDMYYHRPSEELIFMKTNEHRKLHMKENKLGKKLKGHKPWNKGKKCPQISKSLQGSHPDVSNEERKRRRSRMIELNKKQKGKEPWNKGKKTGPANFSEEYREKLRQRMILMNKTRSNKNGKKD